MAQFELPEDDMICEINVTPLVDVSLVLVIIFMVISPFFSRVLKPLLLPGASRAALDESNAIQVSLFPDGTMAVGVDTVEASRLGEVLSKELAGGRAPWAMVRAAEDVPHGRVMDVVGLIKKSGIKRVGFAVKAKAGEAS